MMMMERTALWQHIQATPRHATRFPNAILPSAIYADPVYPQRAVIVEMPFDLPFRCESVFWHTSRLSRREGVSRSDLLGFFAVMTAATHEDSPLFHVVFFAEEVFLLFQKWVYFVRPQPRGLAAKNLLKTYYTKHPLPVLSGGYEQRVIHYQAGCIFADHPHLRRVVML